MKKISICAIALLLVIVPSFISYRCTKGHYERIISGIKTRTDTVTELKVVFVDKPVPYEVIKYRDRVVEVPKDSVVFVKDSSAIQIPLETKLYEKDSVYSAQITGYHTNIDWIKVYPITKTITQTIEVPRKKTAWDYIAVGPAVFVSTEGRLGVGASLTFDVSEFFK